MNTFAAEAVPRRRYNRLDSPATRRLVPGSGALGDDTPTGARPGTVPTDHDFIALHTAYRGFGGLARSHELSRAWASDGAALRGRIEALIDRRRVFSFHWHDSLWLPRFQLDRSAHDGRSEVRRVLDELDASHDGWEIAAWFVEPNVWLKDRAPLECLDDALPQLIDAARADRFVRCG